MIARDNYLRALADGTRSRIVELLAERPRTASEIHRSFPIAAPAVSRHLRVLRDAGLVREETPEHDRRVRIYSLEERPLRELSDWIVELSRGWQAQLEAFRDYVEVRGR
jgi:DNA-binding transcriptional ArsR family regulator